MAENLSIPGSGNPEFILGELAKAFNAQQATHRVIVPTTIGSAGAIRELSEGRASIGRIGRPMKEEERQKGFAYYPLGRDAVVFVAGAEVTVQDITPEQVKSIYTGRLSNWQELGGKRASIRAIGRERSDASFTGIRRGLPLFDDLTYADNIKVVHLDSQLLELLDRYPSSFGFLNRSALNAAKTKLVHLRLQGIEACPENLSAHLYPLWIEFGLIYKPSQLTEAGRDFLAFIKTDEAKRILKTHGLETAAPEISIQ